MNSTLENTSTALMSKEEVHEELVRRLSRREVVTGLIKQAAREAVLDHKRNGVTVSTWRDGKLVIIQPEDIELPED